MNRIGVPFSRVDALLGGGIVALFVPLSIWGGLQHWAGAADVLPIVMLLVSAAYVVFSSIRLASPPISLCLALLTQSVAWGPSLFVERPEREELALMAWMTLALGALGVVVSGSSRWMRWRRLPREQRPPAGVALRSLRLAAIVVSGAATLCAGLKWYCAAARPLPGPGTSLRNAVWFAHQQNRQTEEIVTAMVITIISGTIAIGTAAGPWLAARVRRQPRLPDRLGG